MTARSLDLLEFELRQCGNGGDDIERLRGLFGDGNILTDIFREGAYSGIAECLSHPATLAGVDVLEWFLERNERTNETPDAECFYLIYGMYTNFCKKDRGVLFLKRLKNMPCGVKYINDIFSEDQHRTDFNVNMLLGIGLYNGGPLQAHEAEDFGDIFLTIDHPKAREILQSLAIEHCSSHCLNAWVGHPVLGEAAYKKLKQTFESQIDHWRQEFPSFWALREKEQIEEALNDTGDAGQTLRCPKKM